MSDLSLIGGGSDERTEDESLICLHCGELVRQFVLGEVVWGIVGGGVVHGECYADYVLASQRAMDREAVQG